MVSSLRDQMNAWVAPLIAVAFGALLVHNWVSSAPSSTEETALQLSPYSLRGSALVVDQVPYTLNFAQQTSVADALNRALQVGKEPAQGVTEPLPFQTLVFYRFNNKPDFVIRILGQRGTGLLLEIPEWSTSHYFLDASSGELFTTLKGAFGP